MSEHSPFLNLSLPTLSGLTFALETGRLAPPFYPISLSPYVTNQWVDRVSQELNHLTEQGMNISNIVYLFKMMIAERQKAQHQKDQLDLVWSGLETPGMESRDTQVVVQELFDQAEHKVLIATYAIDQHQKAESLFSKLAKKLDQSPSFRSACFSTSHDPTASRSKKRHFFKILLVYSSLISGQVQDFQMFSMIHDRYPLGLAIELVSMRNVSLSMTLKSLLHLPILQKLPINAIWKQAFS